MLRKATMIAVCCVLFLVGGFRAACADPAPDWKGKTVTIVVGSSPGGGYDLAARILARHFGDHVPGRPAVVVENMPGGGSVNAANYIYSVAPQDGTVIGEVQRPVPFAILFDQPGVRFDASKFQYLGSSTSEVGVTVAWRTAPQITTADLFKEPMIVGGNGTATDTELFARAFNRLLGTKFKIIGGYPGETEIELAMERGEVQGVVNWSWNDIPTLHPDWLKEKKIRLLLQLGAHKAAALPDVPLAQDLAPNAHAKDTIQIIMQMKSLGRPFLIGPRVSPARVAALRAAFDATMRDPAYVADVRRSGGTLDPTSGGDMQTILAGVYAQPKAMIDSAREAMAP